MTKCPRCAATFDDAQGLIEHALQSGYCQRHSHCLPCPHCAEDAKILEEAIGRVVDLILPPPSGFDLPPVVHERRDNLRDALRSLVREIRR